MLLGVDVGGTFTDAVAYDGRALHTVKVPSTPEDQSKGVLVAVETVLERAGATPAEVESFAHGMTVGTNALLTESGARTALVATRGFTDLLDVGRQNRPRLYHLCAPKATFQFRAEGDIARMRVDQLGQHASVPRNISQSLRYRRDLGHRFDDFVLVLLRLRTDDDEAAAR